MELTPLDAVVRLSWLAAAVAFVIYRAQATDVILDIDTGPGYEQRCCKLVPVDGEILTYALPPEDRQRAMDEHIRIGREEFPGITNHTTYSFGIDDQEWTTLVRPSITVVDQPRYRLGAATMNMLIAQIRDVEETA